MKGQKGKKQKWEATRKDYRTYHFTAKEAAKYLLEGVAVCAAADYLFYQNNVGSFSENAEKKMYYTAETGSELSVPGCTDSNECGSSGRILCGECSAGQCEGSGKAL